MAATENEAANMAAFERFEFFGSEYFLFHFLCKRANRPGSIARDSNSGNTVQVKRQLQEMRKARHFEQMVRLA